jgi:hypothetical protein
MFLIDFPFKGCQGRLNRSSIVHAVSYFARGVIDTACTVHAVSMIPHAFQKFEYLREFEFVFENVLAP